MNHLLSQAAAHSVFVAAVAQAAHNVGALPQEQRTADSVIEGVGSIALFVREKQSRELGQLGIDSLDGTLKLLLRTYDAMSPTQEHEVNWPPS